jgi:MoaA/NifB/PqqE/SkfB family radical SAM enzyme
MNIKAIDSQDFNLQISVLNKCNYSCKYCPVDLHSGSMPIIPVKTYTKFITSLLRNNPVINNCKQKFAGLTGGEPTVYPEIESLIQFLRKKDFNISLDTNGSAKREFWEKNLSLINMTNLSVHPRYANFKHILDVVKIGIEKQSIVKVAIIMDHAYWDRAKEALDFFIKNQVPLIEVKGLTLKTSKHRNNNRDKEFTYHDTYTAEQLDWIKQNAYIAHGSIWQINPNYKTRTAFVVSEDGSREKFRGQDLISSEQNTFLNWKCDIGRSNIMIRWNGDVTGASGACRSQNNMIFGNLIQTPNLKVKLTDTPITCRQERCGCISDIRVNKWRE